jgi:methylthioribose-1-phosphate isomerase
MPPLQAIRWARHPTSLTLLDQRLLPGTMKYIDIPGADAAHAAIKVREGATRG